MIKRDPWIWDAYKKGGGHSFPAGHLLRHQAAKMLPSPSICLNQDWRIGGNGDIQGTCGRVVCDFYLMWERGGTILCTRPPGRVDRMEPFDG